MASEPKHEMGLRGSMKTLERILCKAACIDVKGNAASMLKKLLSYRTEPSFLW